MDNVEVSRDESLLESSEYPNGCDWKGKKLVVDDDSTLYLGNAGYKNFYEFKGDFYRSPFIDKLCRDIKDSEEDGTLSEEVDDWKFMVKAVGECAINNDREAMIYEENFIPDRITKFPTRFKNCVDIIFSHNAVIALWYENEDGELERLFFGEAWSVPERYHRLFVIEVLSIIPESIVNADTINLLVHACSKTPEGIPKFQHGAGNKECDTDHGYFVMGDRDELSREEEDTGC